MDARLLQILEGRKGNYPHVLEKKFPHVFHKILELWDKPEIEAYFVELIISNRPTRQGFPNEVASDIVYLSAVHDRMRQRAITGDPWHDADESNGSSDVTLNVGASRKELTRAIELEDFEVVERILNQGFNIEFCDERKWTPLMLSAADGKDKMALLLIQAGANIHHTDSAGYTSLHWAAFNGHAGLVKLLLDHGANVNARSLHGWTALLQAVTRRYTAIVSLLLERGADVNIAADDGWTALHKAASNGRIPEVSLLLARGASRSVRNKEGATPLEVAGKNKHDQVVALLR